MVSSFGERITSDADAPLLGATDRLIGLTPRFAACFHQRGARIRPMARGAGLE
jgi:hypothetical protein